MKIAFLAPIEATTQYKQLYTTIIDYLIQSGHNVTHALSTTEETLNAWSQDKREEYFSTFYNKIGKCDIVIGECSIPSVHVGYEISCAIQQGKDVIILKSKDTVSTIMASDPLYLHKNIFTYEYTASTLLQTLREALEYNPCQKFKKFNILFSPEMVAKLNTISRKKNVPKSVYIRQLLEKGLAREEFE